MNDLDCESDTEGVWFCGATCIALIPCTDLDLSVSDESKPSLLITGSKADIATIDWGKGCYDLTVTGIPFTFATTPESMAMYRSSTLLVESTDQRGAFYPT